MAAEIDLSYAKVQLRSERHDYRLQVTVTNRGSEPLGPYHIDIEMPSRVVASPEAQPTYVPDRSSSDVVFFRVASSNSTGEIYPGDTRLVLLIPYYLDYPLFWSRGDLFEQPVKVTLYRRGFAPFALERPFGDFQVF